MSREQCITKMLAKKKQRNVWKNRFETTQSYMQWHLFNFKLCDLVDFLQEMTIDGNCSVLDIGCGLGSVDYVISKYTQANVTGLDLSTTGIAKAQQTSQLSTSGLSFILGDAESLPIKTRSLDYVIVMDLLEHLPNPLDCIREIERILKKGGLALFSVPNKEYDLTLDKLVELTFPKIFIKRMKKVGHSKDLFFTVSELSEMLEVTRMKPVKTEHYYTFFTSLHDVWLMEFIRTILEIPHLPSHRYRNEKHAQIISRLKRYHHKMFPYIRGVLKLFDRTLQRIGAGSAGFWILAQKK